MEEIWKDIKGYEGLYQVSNFGRVKSLKFGIELVTKNQKMKGYERIKLLKNGEGHNFLVHRLKAIVFIPNPENKRNINHRDGNKSNNGYHEDGNDNLEWCTQGENMKHSYRMLNNIPPMRNKIGSLHPGAKKIDQFTKDGIFIKTWDCAINITRMLGLSNRHISECCNGKIKSSGGFIRKYNLGM